MNSVWISTRPILPERRAVSHDGCVDNEGAEVGVATTTASRLRRGAGEHERPSLRKGVQLHDMFGLRKTVNNHTVNCE